MIFENKEFKLDPHNFNEWKSLFKEARSANTPLDSFLHILVITVLIIIFALAGFVIYTASVLNFLPVFGITIIIAVIAIPIYFIHIHKVNAPLKELSKSRSEMKIILSQDKIEIGITGSYDEGKTYQANQNHYYTLNWGRIIEVQETDNFLYLLYPRFGLKARPFNIIPLRKDSFDNDNLNEIKNILKTKVHKYRVMRGKKLPVPLKSSLSLASAVLIIFSGIYAFNMDYSFFFENARQAHVSLRNVRLSINLIDLAINAAEHNKKIAEREKYMYYYRRAWLYNYAGLYDKAKVDLKKSKEYFEKTMWDGAIRLVDELEKDISSKQTKAKSIINEVPEYGKKFSENQKPEQELRFNRNLKMQKKFKLN